MQVQVTQNNTHNSSVSYKKSQNKQTSLELNNHFISFIDYSKKQVRKGESNQVKDYTQQVQQVSHLTTEQAIERSRKIQDFYASDSKEFRDAKLEYWANKDNPDYEPPKKYAEYLVQIKSVDPRDIILDGKLVRLSLDESSLHNSIYETKGKKLNPKAQMYREWNYQFTIQTKSNKYENAPEFEAFVNKWMAKGLTEDEALSRAAVYAELGLLDYGNQRAVMMYNLPYGDKKEHGFHLIDNPVLKQAIIETLDSLDNDDVSMLRAVSFWDQQYSSLNPEEKPDLRFQDLLNIFASVQKKSSPLKSEYQGFVFDGNINITDKMNYLEKNFIYDNITAYFKVRLDDLNTLKRKEPDCETLDNQINLVETLINNFEKNVRASNESYKEKFSMLQQYLKNTRPNPLQYS